VAGAARRRPHQLAIYLERLAAAWTDGREACPALPFGGRAAPADSAGIAARLLLADAVRAALAAGLELIGVTAPQRM
jgi:arginyl-tRNA synthetase